MNSNFETLMSFVPENNEKVNWEEVENSFLSPVVENYANTHQRLDYHGEDDVWTHTKMVVDRLVELPDYKEFDKNLKQALFTAAFFHDLGKVYTTVKENGEWTSPYHASVGAEKFKELAAKELGSEEDKEINDFVELVSLLIANHVKPMHALKKRFPEKELEKLVANQKLAPDFTLKLLSTLVEADMTGRISKDLDKSKRTIQNFRKLAKKLDLYETKVED